MAAASPKDTKKAKKPDLSDPTLDRTKLPVTVLRGVGGKMAETLERLGVRTVGDLLMHMPTRYTKIGEVRPLAYWQKGQLGRVEVTVEKALVRHGKRIKMVVAEATDEKGRSVVLTWFGQHWLARQLPTRTLVVQGEFDQPLRDHSPARLTVREWEFADDLEDADYRESLRPTYAATEGLSQARIRGLVSQALDLVETLEDPLPEHVRTRHSLRGLREALELVHRPEEVDQAREGRRRLVFDELFPAQLALLLLRRRDANNPAPVLDDDRRAAEVIEALPFTLSDGQKEAWSQLRAHLLTPSPTRVMLQGEVGSGKTVIAALALATAASSGRVAALLAPTEILAAQHAESIRAFLGPAGLGVALVTGSQKSEEREAALSELESGRALVAVGTHALFSEGLARFADRLALVVVDEQHRFGVAQRHALVEEAQRQGTGVHLVQLSATPIPRSLAMTVFGDLDLLDLPMRTSAKRQVKTLVVGDEYGWVGPLKETVARGDGAFIIAPRIDDEGEGWAVNSPELRIWLRDFKWGVAHGRQTQAERADVLARFAAGDLDVLVATTVIEVGIDIKRASLIAILDADRFGLAQLHQLRGRVGRAGQEALCVLQPSVSAGEEGIERLSAMTRMQDGKELAEFDLELRGTGAFVGEAQAGKSGFKLANLSRDGATLVEARETAMQMLQEDPTLGRPEHLLIRADILARIATMLRVRQS